MADLSIGATLALGLMLGLRHALDADHVAAVATLVEGRDALRRAALTGLLWGLGHAVTLGVVGLMLVGLGVRAPRRLRTIIHTPCAGDCVPSWSEACTAWQGPARSSCWSLQRCRRFSSDGFISGSSASARSPACC